jgi:hypothetical protein
MRLDAHLKCWQWCPIREPPIEELLLFDPELGSVVAVSYVGTPESGFVTASTPPYWCAPENLHLAI